MTLGDRIAVLRNGRLQQCGTPLDVYHSPANRFAAGFIGTPSMNFIEGRLRKDAAGQFWFESASVRMPIDKSQVRGNLPSTDDKVVLGIRPDNLRLQPARSSHSDAKTSHSERNEESRGANEILRCAQNDEKARLPQNPWIISSTVEVVEPLGSTVDLHVRIADGHRLVCRVPAIPIACDSQVTLHVDASKVHLFAAGDSNP